MLEMSFASLTPKKKLIRAEQFLQEMDQVIPWERLVNASFGSNLRSDT